MRYYLGVDWADQEHVVWVEDETGAPVATRTLPHTAAGFADCGRVRDAWRQAGIKLWAGIERPEGRGVEFLLDHAVVVVPLNPKVVARTREHFRPSAAKSDPLDARVCAYCVRTRQHDVAPLRPSSAAMQELKLLTRNHQRLERQHTRLLNQATLALKEYYPLVLDMFGDFGSVAAQTFVRAYPTPSEAAGMRRSTCRPWAARRRSPTSAGRCASSTSASRVTSTCVIMRNSLPRPHCGTVSGRVATTAVSGSAATVTSGRCAPWPASGSSFLRALDPRCNLRRSAASQDHRPATDPAGHMRARLDNLHRKSLPRAPLSGRPGQKLDGTSRP